MNENWRIQGSITFLVHLFRESWCYAIIVSLNVLSTMYLTYVPNTSEGWVPTENIENRILGLKNQWTV